MKTNTGIKPKGTDRSTPSSMNGAPSSNLRCLPKSVCSWEYLIQGEGVAAEVEINFLGESGYIHLHGNRYSVAKQGMFSGTWIMSSADGQEVAAATQAGILWPDYTLRAGNERLTLRKSSLLSRSFDFVSRDCVVGQITPDHAFTRRATIRFIANPCSMTTTLLGFFLVVINWRRQSQSS